MTVCQTFLLVTLNGIKIEMIQMNDMSTFVELSKESRENHSV